MGGGPKHTTSTVNQSNLPEYARPYYESLMARGQAESRRPYQAYQGERLAGISGDTQTGFGMGRDWAGSDTGLGGAMGALGQGMQNATNVGYQPGQFNHGYDPTGAYQDITQGWGGVNHNGQQVGDGVNQLGVETWNSDVMNQYMSPYMQAVVDKSKQDAVRSAQEEAVYRNSQAATTGAFGGSRHAVQQQMATNAMMNRLTDIDVQGAQSAYENAQQQFERDRQARFGADSGNQQAALSMQQQNLQSLLGTQEARDRSAQQLGQMNLSQQQMGDQSQQALEQYRQSGIGLQGEAASRLAQMAGQQDQMMMDRIRMQLGIGQANEDYRQQELDMAYNDFVNQRDAGRQNLQFISSLLHGVPVSANRDVTTSQPTNPLAGLLGTSMGMQALNQLGQQS